MNDINKLLQQINQITAPARQVTSRLNNVLPPYINQLNELLRPTLNSFKEIAGVYTPYLNKIHASIAKSVEAATKWQIARKEDVALMAENGWYPNWCTFFYTPETSVNSLDELMEKHLEDDWDDITTEILNLCPNRKHILENAFNLHRNGNYIASIPLFLAQADGICCEVLKSFLFTGNETQDRLNNLIDDGQISANMFTDVFLEPFRLKNHHNAGISKSTEKSKRIAPNRNGILHGHRKHLDYGTKINSLKCFSLLSFIVYSLKDVIKEASEKKR